MKIIDLFVMLKKVIHSLKYLRYATFGSKDIVIRKKSLRQRLNSFVKVPEIKQF